VLSERQIYGQTLQPPLRNFRVRWLLPDYKFRFRNLRKGGFFSILQVFAVMGEAPVLSNMPQVMN